MRVFRHLYQADSTSLLRQSIVILDTSTHVAPFPPALGELNSFLFSSNMNSQLVMASRYGHCERSV